jgi:hypothetical protein
MTYADERTRWPSPHNWVAMRNEIERIWGQPSSVPWVDTMPKIRVVSLAFSVSADKRVSMHSSFGSEKRWRPERENGVAEEGLTVRLLDPSGKVVISQSCRPLACPAGTPDDNREFVELLPWDESVTAVEVNEGEEVLAHFEVAEAPPVLTGVRVERSDERLSRVSWAATAGAAEVFHALRYSADSGENWIALVVGAGETSHVVNMELLPGGERCQFQVLASAGFRTATVESEPFSRPVLPRRALLVSPAAGEAFESSAAVALLGAGHSPDFGTPPPDEIIWTSNRDGFLGAGYELTLTDLSVGPHRISVSVPDGLGGEAVANVSIRVKPAGERQESPGSTGGALRPS